MNRATNVRTKIVQSLHLGKAIKLVWQSTPGWTLGSFLLTLIQGFLPLLALNLIKLIVDAVTAGLAAPDTSLAFQRGVVFIMLAGLVALLNGLCGSLADFVREAQTQRIVDHVSDVIHAKSVALDLEYYENPAYHDTLHRAQAGDYVSLCFKQVGTVRYNIWTDLSDPLPSMSPTAVIQLEEAV